TLDRPAAGAGAAFAEAVTPQRLGPEEAQVAHVPLRKRIGLIRKHSVKRRAARHTACDRPDRIEAGGKWQRALLRHTCGSRLETDKPGQRCRNTAGTARVRTERTMRHAIGNRDRSTGGRTAWNTLVFTIPGIERCTVVRIDA